MVVGILRDGRVRIVTAFFTLTYVCIVAYSFFLQVYENSFFTSIGNKQYKLVITRKPPRAPIFDRNSQPIAFDKEILSAFITPNNLSEKVKVQRFLKQYFPDALKRLEEHPELYFSYVKRHLTPEEIVIINKAELADIRLLREQRRFYAIPSLGNTIGTTDIDNHGLSGIELIFDKQLAGTPTTYLLEKDARSTAYYFKRETKTAGIEGHPIKLTIDSDLQFIAYDNLKSWCKKLAAKEGMVLIMNPQNGELLALACYPDFDPNKPAPDELALTKNRIFTEVHEFGSVMKVFPALAALDEKVVIPDEIIDCENKRETYINGIRITTWRAFGPQTYTDVIRTSNNIGTSKVSLRLGKKLYDHLSKCGFGNKTNLCFPGEQCGFITPPHAWSKATPLSLSFGYEISASLLQLACGFSLFATNGFLPIPKLVYKQKTEDRPQQIYRSEPIQTMRQTLTLEPQKGVGYFGYIPGFTVMGKTGSSYLISNGSYDKTRSLYTFAGIIEGENYQRLIVTSIREPQQTGKQTYATTMAVPLFKIIAEQMVVHEQATPRS
ncbi:MAG: penicillin-binding protein 2 [Candidatus Babeliaceae bacterium]|nr:penicillin-binding protein 2 [Candidatus Babeliaceae bacterium]